MLTNCKYNNYNDTKNVLLFCDLTSKSDPVSWTSSNSVYRHLERRTLPYSSLRISSDSSSLFPREESKRIVASARQYITEEESESYNGGKVDESNGREEKKREEKRLGLSGKEQKGEASRESCAIIEHCIARLDPGGKALTRFPASRVYIRRSLLGDKTESTSGLIAPERGSAGRATRRQKTRWRRESCPCGRR